MLPINRFIAFIYALVIAANSLVMGIDPSRPANHFQLNVFTSENGLPMNTVISLAQTPDGFIWIGTETGLVRFDGITFDIYNRENTPVLTNDLIRALLVDRQGTLWIGTRGGGVVLYKNGAFETFDTQDLISDTVWTLEETRDGSIWIGSANGCLRYLDGILEKISLPIDVISDNIRSIEEDQDGQVWLGTLAGLIVVKKKGETLVSEYKGFRRIKVNTIMEDRSGILWVGTMGNGLLRISQGKNYFFNQNNTFSSNEITSIIEDFAGNLWIGSYGGGIYYKRPNTNKILHFNENIDIASNSIFTFLEDREKTLWIGTEGGGLNNIHETKVITYTKKDGLTHEIIYTLFEDSRGGLWTGTTGSGADCLKNDSVRNVNRTHGLSSNTIISFAEHPDGFLWLGTRNNGVNRLNTHSGNVDEFNTHDGLTGNIVRSLYVDTDGILWAGTDNGGLHQFFNDRFLLIKKIQFRINTIFKDNQGTVWIGTWGDGLYRLKDDILQKRNQQNGFPSDVVFCIHQDEKGVLWIGTAGNGLIRFNRNTCTSITKTDGLHDNTIYSIIEDDKNNFWMSSNDGIISINRLELEKYLRNKKYKFHSTIFSKADGMRSTECNGGGQPAGIISSKKQIWFPTTRGISMVDPAHIPINTLPPPVVIKEFLVNGKPVSTDAVNPIFSWEKGVKIHYTALSFIVPDRIQFKYRLKGYDEKWVDAGSLRIAEYPDLPPGEYQFSVMAANSDGTWNREGQSFKFNLTPKFYQTFFFKSALLIILILVSYGLYFLGKKIDQIRRMRKKFHLSFLDKEKKDEYIRKIFYFIEMKQSYKNPDLSLNTFARDIDINPRYLSQLINDELEKGFLDLINSYRIEDAKKLLSDPARHDMTVLEICMEVGFNSKSSFNRSFKKFTQQTPSEFKKNYHH